MPKTVKQGIQVLAALAVAGTFAVLGNRATGLMRLPGAANIDPVRLPGPGMDTVSWQRAGTPDWVAYLDREVSQGRPPAGPSTVVYVVVSARDCLSCIDLGRRLREYLLVPGRLALMVVTPPDSAVVARFLVREKLSSALLRIADRVPPIDGAAAVLPPALTVHGIGDDSIDVIALKWSVADSVSIQGLMNRRLVQ